jgi:hypothetical protein
MHRHTRSGAILGKAWTSSKLNLLSTATCSVAFFFICVLTPVPAGVCRAARPLPAKDWVPGPYRSDAQGTSTEEGSGRGSRGWGSGATALRLGDKGGVHQDKKQAATAGADYGLCVAGIRPAAAIVSGFAPQAAELRYYCS